MRMIAASAFLLLVYCSGSAQRDSVFTVVSTDSVIVWNTGANEQCAARFMLDVTPARDSIIVIERDTRGAIATCSCTFNLSVSIAGLPARHYLAVVYREYLKKYGYPQDMRRLIGTARFVIGVPRSAYVAHGFQSPCMPSHISELPEKPSTNPVLHSNYPNPFNASTKVCYDVPSSSHVTIAVVDLVGHEVARLVSEYKLPGSYLVGWDSRGTNGRHVASGVYLCRMMAGSFHQTKKLLVLQ